jgi:hypothetical protein
VVGGGGKTPTDSEVHATHPRAMANATAVVERVINHTSFFVVSAQHFRRGTGIECSLEQRPYKARCKLFSILKKPTIVNGLPWHKKWLNKAIFTKKSALKAQ